MNADLELRLRPLNTSDKEGGSFIRYLMAELGPEAMGSLTYDSDMRVFFNIETIENGEDDSAYVIGDGTTFTLVIDKRMPFGMIVDFLIHELAHVHSWECADDKEDHCDEFGKSYALLYRKYLELYDMYWG
jgi:hypothetical protein